MIDDKCQLWWLVWCGGSIWPWSRLACERWLPHLNTACPSNLNSHSSILDRNLDVILHDQTDIYDCLTVNSLYVDHWIVFWATTIRAKPLLPGLLAGGNYYNCAWHRLICKSFNWPTIISTTSLQKRAKSGTASLPHNFAKLSWCDSCHLWNYEWLTHWPNDRGNCFRRDALEEMLSRLKRNACLFLTCFNPLFPYVEGGEGGSSQNFCKFTKLFLVCQNHS